MTRQLRHLRLLLIAMAGMVALAACSSSSAPHRTAGETVDDATITTEVKAKLAAEKISTLAKVDVDTKLRTVYLNGVVDSENTRLRAESIARNVKGVNAVVNNLTVKTSG